MKKEQRAPLAITLVGTLIAAVGVALIFLPAAVIALGVALALIGLFVVEVPEGDA